MNLSEEFEQIRLLRAQSLTLLEQLNEASKNRLPQSLSEPKKSPVKRTYLAPKLKSPVKPKETDLPCSPARMLFVSNKQLLSKINENLTKPDDFYRDLAAFKAMNQSLFKSTQTDIVNIPNQKPPRSTDTDPVAFNPNFAHTGFYRVNERLYPCSIDESIQPPYEEGYNVAISIPHSVLVNETKKGHSLKTRNEYCDVNSLRIADHLYAACLYNGEWKRDCNGSRL